MADYNKILDAGDVDGGVINVVIEIPKWSTLKIEWNRKLATFELDRVEPSIFAKPVNYGFIPQTLDEYGDELDALVITNEPIPTGVYLKARVVGVLNFEDDGEMVATGNATTFTVVINDVVEHPAELVSTIV